MTTLSDTHPPKTHSPGSREPEPGSRLLKITGAQFDSMVEHGAFDDFPPSKIELIHGELRIVSPAGPIHCDLIDYLTRWSVQSNADNRYSVRVQSCVVAGENRLEPDLAWLANRRYTDRHPGPEDVGLMIEVADSSLSFDLRTKSAIYASHGITEYWVVDARHRRIHVMRQPTGDEYDDIQIITRGNPIAPACRPEATLDTVDLFVDA